MNYKQGEVQSELGKRQSEEAVELAMRGCWEEAVVVNQGLIEGTPSDVGAYNRLGKALYELGELNRAMEAYSTSLKLEPTNAIAVKNLARLRKRLGIAGESATDNIRQATQPTTSDSMNEQHIVAERGNSEKEESSEEINETLPEGFSSLE